MKAFVKIFNTYQEAKNWRPLENLKKVENPCEIDESESDKNEMVIFDE